MHIRQTHIHTAIRQRQATQMTIWWNWYWKQLNKMRNINRHTLVSLSTLYYSNSIVTSLPNTYTDKMLSQHKYVYTIYIENNCLEQIELKISKESTITCVVWCWTACLHFCYELIAPSSRFHKFIKFNRRSVIQWTSHRCQCMSVSAMNVILLNRISCWSMTSGI